MASYSRSRSADQDLLDIYLFGVERFGPVQAARYLEELEDCFQLLPDNPRMGRKADIIAPGLRRHEHASHVILYVQSNGGVEIAAIVHKSSLRGLRK